MIWIEDEKERADIKIKAQTAIKKLTNIVNECDLIRAYVPYMTEKIEWAEAMVFNIHEKIRDAERKGEEEK